jgi:two-component system, LuxR family, sensor kinase FixL
MRGHSDGPTQLNILLVEDDLFQQKLIRHRLERESFLVTTVSSATEAIQAIREREFAIAIIDLGLPDASGLALIRDLNANSKHTRVIIHSADGTFASAKEGVNLGVLGYVEKSEDLHVLIERVHFAATEYLHEVLTRAEGEIRFHLRVLDVIEDGVIATNLNYEMIYWNRHAVELLGGRERFFYGAQSLDFLFVRRNCKAIADNLNHAQSGGSITGQSRLRRISSESKDSKTLWVRLPVRYRVSPILDTSNRIIGFVFTFSDITRERETQHALRTFANQQAVLAQIGSLGLEANCIDTFLESIRPCVARALRVDDCRFVDESVLDRDSERSNAQASENAFDSVYRVEMKSSDPSHSMYCMLLTTKKPRVFRENEEVFLGSVSKLIGNTISRFLAANRWQSLFENSLNAIVLLDDDGFCIDANGAAVNQFSIPRPDLRGIHLRSLIESSDEADFERYWGDFRDQKKMMGEVKLKTRAGLVRDATFVAIASVVPGVNMIDFRDITEKKRLQEKVHQDLAILSHFQRNAAIGQMAAVLAHEINQPLGAISNYVGGLLLSVGAAHNQKVDPAEMSGTLTEVQCQALRASEILRRLRRFVARLPVETQYIDLNALVIETTKLVQFDFQIHEVEVKFKLQDGLPNIHGDPIQIQQVVVNLLKNAVEALVNLVPGPRIVQIRSYQDDDFVVLKISDNGLGADDSLLAQMFQPYFTSKPTGLGLGLNISKSIVEQHKGQIDVARGDNGGLEFTLRFHACD